MGDPVRLTWLASIDAPGGYDDEARAFLLAMHRAGVPVALRTFDWTSIKIQLPTETQMLFDEMRSRRIHATNRVTVSHLVPHDRMRTSAGFTGVHISRCMFETDRTPASWLAPLLQMDEIWVPTEFNLRTFAQTGVPEHKLKVLGGTLDFGLYDPAKAVLPRPLGDPQRFTFLTLFDFSARKGWRQLLDAWAAAFSSSDDVQLILKVQTFQMSGPEIEQRVHEHLRARGADHAPVIVHPDTVPVQDMPGLYLAADAFVLPTRGEGWGRPVMEALAMGLPTIVSDFSAHTEFALPEFTWLTPGRLVVADDPDLPRHRGHRWFEADVEALATQMQEVYGDPQRARQRAATARPYLLDRFSPDRVAARIAALADEAWETHSDRRWRAGAVLRVLRDDKPRAVAPFARCAARLADRLGGVPLLTPGGALDDAAVTVSDGAIIPVSAASGFHVHSADACDAQTLLASRHAVDLFCFADPTRYEAALSAGIAAGHAVLIGDPLRDPDAADHVGSMLDQWNRDALVPRRQVTGERLSTRSFVVTIAVADVDDGLIGALSRPDITVMLYGDDSIQADADGLRRTEALLDERQLTDADVTFVSPSTGDELTWLAMQTSVWVASQPPVEACARTEVLSPAELAGRL